MKYLRQGKEYTLHLPLMVVAGKNDLLKARLQKLCQGQVVTVKTEQTDNSATVLDGDLELPDGRTLSRELIAEGLAVEKSPVLKGNIERVSASASLSQQVAISDANAGNRGLFQARVSERQGDILQAQVQNKQASFRGQVQSRIGQMTITQTKKLPLAPPPVPVYDRPPSRAVDPRRAGVAEHAPLRGLLTDSAPPLRSEASSAPLRANLAHTQPLRPNEQAPVRSLDLTNAPLRAAASTAAPSRQFLAEGPPERSFLSYPSTPVRQVTPNFQKVEQNTMPPQENFGTRYTPSPFGGNSPRKSTKSTRAQFRELPARQPSDAAQAKEAERLESLLWDKWYADFNELLCKKLERTMPSHGYPAGTNMVHILVTSDHRLEVHLMQGSSAPFNDAILEAYQALNGNSKLKFPSGSGRDKVEFDSNHNQDVAGPANMSARSIQGDREIIKGR